MLSQEQDQEEEFAGPIKLVFTGPTGAGKTTAIGAISEIEPVRTDVKASDEVADMKDTTTVAMDYGQITLEDGQILQLFGTPGQERFAYMRKVLSRGGLGLILLIDNAGENPLEDVATYLESFDDFVKETSAVIGVVRSDVSATPTLDEYQAFLMERELNYPVLFVDVRERDNVVLLLEVLLTTLEFE